MKPFTEYQSRDNARGIKGPVETPQQNQPLGSGALGSLATVLAFGVAAYVLVNLIRR